jgi:hypothetical protein
MKQSLNPKIASQGVVGVGTTAEVQPGVQSDGSMAVEPLSALVWGENESTHQVIVNF